MDERNQPDQANILADIGVDGRNAMAADAAWSPVSAVQQVLSRAADLLLPPLCPGCLAPVASHQGLCPPCWTQLRFLSPPLCPVHGTPLPPGAEDGMLSPAAIAQPPAFSRARAAVAYEGVAARIVTSFKYADRNDFTPLMARLMCQAGSVLLEDADLIVPVPLHWRRLFSRRFNQSAELARQICALRTNDYGVDGGIDRGIDRGVDRGPDHGADIRPDHGRGGGPRYAADLLIRRKATRQQVGLQAAQRALNVAGAFAVLAESKPALAGKRVVLVDDVFTTGATVAACARVLLRAGAQAVDVLTFARVLDEG
jgi:predicted amidophosphoribosyltransferase